MVQVVARLLADTTGATVEDQRVPLGDTTVNGVGDSTAHSSVVAAALLDVEVVAVDSEAVDGRPDVDGPDHDRVAGVGPQQRSARIAVLVRAEPQRRIGAAVADRCSVQVDGRVGHRVVVERPDHHLTEAAVDKTCSQRVDHPVDLGVRVDVDDRAGPDLGAGGRIVVGGVLRLDDQHADATVTPAVDAIDVVVPEDVVEQRVRVPAITDELDARAFTSSMVGRQRPIENDRLGGRVDRNDRRFLDAVLAEPDTEGDAGAILRHRCD